MKLSALKNNKAFTLIELLVVIAVIGVLAAIVLLAADPAEQLRRGRDTARQSAITQMGRAMQAYFTTANPSLYPAQGTAALDVIATSGDLKTIPINPTYATVPAVTCAAANLQSTTTPVSNYCYLTTTSPARAESLIYARMESNLNNNKCSATSNIAWFVFNTAAGRAGIFCKATEPVVGDIVSTMVFN